MSGIPQPCHHLNFWSIHLNFVYLHRAYSTFSSACYFSLHLAADKTETRLDIKLICSDYLTLSYY